MEELQDALNQRVEEEDTGGSEADEERNDDPEDMDAVEKEIIGKSVS